MTLILAFWTMKTLAQSMFITCTFLWNTLNQIQFPFPYHCCPLQISCPSSYRVYQTGDCHLESLKKQAFAPDRLFGVRTSHSKSTIRSFCSIWSIEFSELFAVRARRSVRTVRYCSIFETIAVQSSVDFDVHVINNVHDKILVEWIGVRISTWNDTVWMQRKHDRFLIRI